MDKPGVGFTVTPTLAVALDTPLVAVTLIVYVVFVLTLGAFWVKTAPEPENPAGLLRQAYVTGDAILVGVAVRLTGEPAQTAATTVGVIATVPVATLSGALPVQLPKPPELSTITQPDVGGSVDVDGFDR
jgi:hypothetical protein